MGMFKDMRKGMKDLQATVAAAPAMIDEAERMRANAAAMQQAALGQMAAADAAQRQAMAGLAPGAPIGAPPARQDGVFEPIAGVSLALYVEITKGLAAYGYDQSKALDIAMSKGVPADVWAAAMEGWNARITANRAVAQEYNRMYTGR
ncbi:MAG: hypothetical protein U0Q03_24715 [Acidimicrobiales bacterium]